MSKKQVKGLVVKSAIKAGIVIGSVVGNKTGPRSIVIGS